jgi:hypothetical protein
MAICSDVEPRRPSRSLYCPKRLELFGRVPSRDLTGLNFPATTERSNGDKPSEWITFRFGGDTPTAQQT